MKKATKKPEGNFPGLQEFMDRLPEIVALMKPEPTPLPPYTPYKPPPDRWVFGEHMAINLSQLLDGADWIRLHRRTPAEAERHSKFHIEACLEVRRGEWSLHMALEPDIADCVFRALEERFPQWPISWPEPELEPKPGVPPKKRQAIRQTTKVD